jgi:hypothetical protein
MRFLPLALAAFPLPVLADNFTAESMPTAVTIYGGFAMVTREVSIDVPATTRKTRAVHEQPCRCGR